QQLTRGPDVVHVVEPLQVAPRLQIEFIRAKVCTACRWKHIANLGWDVHAEQSSRLQGCFILHDHRALVGKIARPRVDLSQPGSIGEVEGQSDTRADMLDGAIEDIPYPKELSCFVRARHVAPIDLAGRHDPERRLRIWIQPADIARHYFREAASVGFEFRGRADYAQR